MSEPFFSILTASFNYGSTIRETLESVCHQEFPSYEHIVVDGASTDGTLEVLRSYQNRYTLKWISEPDRGISDAMNKGIRLARGKYILVIQADDRLISGTILTQIYEQVASEEYDIYGFPIVYFDEAGRIREFGPSIYYRYYYKLKNCLRSQGTFIHMRLFDRIGLFRDDLQINMDYDLYYRAMQHGCSVGIGTSPVAVMGRSGISSQQENTERRIALEFRVQRENERSRIWRAIQCAYRPIYSLYKFGWKGAGVWKAS